MLKIGKAGFVFLLVITSCAGQYNRKTEGVISPGKIMSNQDQYDGRHVRVRGYVMIGPERRIIVDSPREYQKERRSCIGLDGAADYFSKHQDGYRIISGVFKKNLCGEKDICLYWCNDAGIIMD